MRKIYLSGAMLLALGLGAFAQSPVAVSPFNASPHVPHTVPQKNYEKKAGEHRGQIGMYVDYDASEEANVASYARFAWDFNTNYTNPPDTFTYTYVIVGFDSVYDVSTDIGYAYDQVQEIVVDTIFFALGHVNISGQNDTLILDVIALNANGYPTNTVLWSDTTITATTLTGPSWLNFGAFQVTPPNLVITPPAKFGVRLRYYGPLVDTVGFLAGYADAGTCAGIAGLTTSAFKTLFANGSAEANTYFYYNRFADQFPRPDGSSIYLDCLDNDQYDEGINEEYFIQNAGIWYYGRVTVPGVGINDISPDLDVSVYPNPAQNQLHIGLEATQVDNYTITITNIEGAVVYAETINGSLKLGHDIDLSGMSDGVYFLKVHDGVSVAAEQFVISR